MAISGGDGSIILTTKVDTSGIEKGTANIKNATERTNKSVKNLGLELSRALNAGDTKSAQLINNFKKATEEVEKQSVKVDELKSKLQGLESGQIKIEDKGTAKLQSDFEKATASVEKTQNEINELYMQLDRLQMEAFKAPDTGNIVFTGKEQAEFDKLNARLDELEPKLEANKQKASELGIALKNAAGTGTQAEIEKTRTKLSEAENKLQNLSTKAEIAGQKMNGGMNTYHKEVSSTEQALSKLGNRIGRLAISALIFSAITKAFTELRQTIGSALMSNEDFRNSVYALQAALWVVAQPIYEAILPALQTLIRWLTIGILYIATFFSALGGKTLKQTMASAKALNKQSQAFQNASKSAGKSAKSTNKATKAMKDLAKETGEANKELADFDDLIIIGNKSIDEIETPSGGYGGTGGGINSAFDDLESLLNDSDMENLQDFENWVLTHQDSIKTALEIAGLGLLGLAIGGVISKIGDLLGWFKKKDDGLDTQTKKTQTETEAVRELSNAWSLAPAFAFSLVPALDGLTASGKELIPTFQTATDKSYGLAPAFDTSRESAYGLAPALDGATSSATNLSPAFQTATDKMSAFDVMTKVVMPSIQTVIATAMNNAKKNISDFCTNAQSNFASWSDSLQQNATNTATVIADNVYEAFNSAGNNINDFVTITSTNVRSWANSVATNISNAAQTIATNWGNALSSAWQNFKNFMSATGKRVSGFWSEHKATIIGVTLAAATVAGAVALAPYTGGASLAVIPPLAKGGIVPHATTALIGEKGKEAVLPLENNTEWMDMLAERILMRSANINIGGGNTEVVLEIDGREFGRAVVEQGNKENRRIGTKLVIA